MMRNDFFSIKDFLLIKKIAGIKEYVIKKIICILTSLDLY